MQQVAEHVEAERRFAQPAQPLEHEDALTFAERAPQPVQLAAAADEAGGQDPAIADTQEGSARNLVERGGRGRTFRGVQGMVRAAMVEHELRPGEGVGIAGELGGRRGELAVVRHAAVPGRAGGLDQRLAGLPDGEPRGLPGAIAAYSAASASVESASRTGPL